MTNPYLPIWQPTSIEQSAVLKPELQRQHHRAQQWDLGRADRMAGLPCRSPNGAYLEGWYSVPNDYKPVRRDADSM